MSIRNKKHRLMLSKVEKLMQKGLSKEEIAKKLNLQTGKNHWDKKSVKYYVFCINVRKIAKKRACAFSNKEIELLKKIGKDASKEEIMRKIKKINPSRKSWEGIKIILRERLHFDRKHTAYDSQYKQFKKPKCSEDYAWFLGVLAGDAYTIGYTVALKAKDKSFIDKFSEVSSKLFELKPYKSLENGKYHTSKFFSIKLVHYLGNWKKSEGEWAKTLINDFPWILKNNKYIISFLTGFFDSEGSVICKRHYKTKKLQTNVYLSSLPKNTRLLLSNMLKRLDIKNRIAPQYICIGGLIESKKFASLIKSCIKRREKTLNIIRKIKIIIDPNRLKCHKKVKELRKQNLALRHIYKNVESYGVPRTTINEWVYRDQKLKAKIVIPEVSS